VWFLLTFEVLRIIPNHGKKVKINLPKCSSKIP
jgi:hypothetical protein